MKKLSLFGLGLLTPLLLGLFVAHTAHAITEDDLRRNSCWLEEDCKKYGGLWGLPTAEEKNKNINPFGKDGYTIDGIKCGKIPEKNGKPTARCFAGNPTVTLQVAIPGVTQKGCSVYELGKEPTTCVTNADCADVGGTCVPIIKGGFPAYIQKFYKFFVGAMAVIAVVMIMWNGFKRIMAAGSSEGIKAANDGIFGALVGLVLTLISYSLLSLINPALVNNVMPKIDKVKPDFYGEWCPNYHAEGGGNKILYKSGYQVKKCKEGSNNNNSCNNDTDCPKGTCAESTEYSKDDTIGNTCGQQMVVNGRTCMGAECNNGEGCFPVRGGDNKIIAGKYKCDYVALYGNITATGKNNPEINYISLQPICTNDGAELFMNAFIPGIVGNNLRVSYKKTLRCNVAPAQGTDFSSIINVKEQGSYTIDDCFALDKVGIDYWPPVRSNGKKYAGCTDEGDVKGYALLVEVETSGPYYQGAALADDWYAIDASSCASGTVKPIRDSSNRTNIFNLNWSGVSDDKLFWLQKGLFCNGGPKAGDVCTKNEDCHTNDEKRFVCTYPKLGNQKCDLNIKYSNFPKH